MFSSPVRGYVLMGKAARQRPARLAEKLVGIRTALGVSQNGMVRKLGLQDRFLREDISRFERGIGGEPPLDILLRYARAISTTGRGEFLEAIIDDEMDLPETMPADPRKHVRYLAEKDRRAKQNRRK